MAGIANLASMGRRGDTELAHLTKGEVVIPKEIAKLRPDLIRQLVQQVRGMGGDPSRLMVGAGVVNPKTGLEEFATQEEIQAAYAALGRAPDAEGAAYWENYTGDDFVTAFRNAAENNGERFNSMDYYSTIWDNRVANQPLSKTYQDLASSYNLNSNQKLQLESGSTVMSYDSDFFGKDANFEAPKRRVDILNAVLLDAGRYKETPSDALFRAKAQYNPITNRIEAVSPDGTVVANGLGTGYSAYRDLDRLGVDPSSYAPALEQYLKTYPIADTDKYRMMEEARNYRPMNYGQAENAVYDLDEAKQAYLARNGGSGAMNLKEFMDASGLPSGLASNLLYANGLNVYGGNLPDFINWDVVKNSKNPAATLQSAINTLATSQDRNNLNNAFGAFVENYYKNQGLQPQQGFPLVSQQPSAQQPVAQQPLTQQSYQMPQQQAQAQQPFDWANFFQSFGSPQTQMPQTQMPQMQVPWFYSGYNFGLPMQGTAADAQPAMGQTQQVPAAGGTYWGGMSNVFGAPNMSYGVPAYPAVSTTSNKQTGTTSATTTGTTGNTVGSGFGLGLAPGQRPIGGLNPSVRNRPGFGG